MSQIAIPAVYMRGGTSRALVFRRDQLPSDRGTWDAIFLAAMGSPDPHGRQLDGLGGGISSLSKVAVVGPPTRLDADVDYTFGQVAVGHPAVHYRANCGNISAAIGPFAIDEGLVAPCGNPARVRILNTNTGKIIEAMVPLVGGKAAVDGDLAQPGVARTGAPIRLAFLDPGGSATGRLLPTGHVRDRLGVTAVGSFEVSCIDAVNPIAFVAASDLGLRGDEAADILARNVQVMHVLEEIRVAAAVVMGLGDERAARHSLRNLPFVSVVAAPADAASTLGERLSVTGVDVTTRVISSGQPHRAIPVSAAISLAIAVRIPGTVPNLVASVATGGRDVRIGHPSGITMVGATVSSRDGIVAEEAVIYRTARRLMQGQVLVPASAVHVGL